MINHYRHIATGMEFVVPEGQSPEQTAAELLTQLGGELIAFLPVRASDVEKPVDTDLPPESIIGPAPEHPFTGNGGMSDEAMRFFFGDSI